MAFSKELEEVIEAALADGVLTDKERAVLHKKAAQEGVDPDELDVVVEGRLAKMKREEDWLRPTPPPATEKRGNVVKCPHCGSPIQAGAVKCEECGYVFTNVKANRSSELLASMLQGYVNKKYEHESDKGQDMANVIRNFPVPTSKEDMIEFIASMLPKTFQTTADEGDSAHYLPPAYLAKLEECILKAKVSFPGDPQIEELIRAAEKSKTRRMISKLYHSFGFWFLMFYVALGLVGLLTWLVSRHG